MGISGLDDGVVANGTDIAQREGLHHSTVNELLRLTLLEPAIIPTILAGKQPRCMSLIWFQRNPLPLDWIEQRRVFEQFDPWWFVGQSVGIADHGKAAPNPRKCTVPRCDYPQGKQRKETGLTGKWADSPRLAGV